MYVACDKLCLYIHADHFHYLELMLGTGREHLKNRNLIWSEPKSDFFNLIWSYLANLIWSALNVLHHQVRDNLYVCRHARQNEQDLIYLDEEINKYLLYLQMHIKNFGNWRLAKNLIKICRMVKAQDFIKNDLSFRHQCSKNKCTWN